MCSWRLVEAAQGIQNALPNDKSVLGGLNEATYLAQQAKSHGLNVMRLFGIADVNYNEGAPLQPSPGLLPRLQSLLYCHATACTSCGVLIHSMRSLWKHPLAVSAAALQHNTAGASPFPSVLA